MTKPSKVIRQKERPVTLQSDRPVLPASARSEEPAAEVAPAPQEDPVVEQAEPPTPEPQEEGDALEELASMDEQAFNSLMLDNVAYLNTPLPA